MLKKILLNKSIFFAISIFLFAFSGNVKAQCSITSSISSSSLTCGTLPLNSCDGILYIGNGIDAMTLTMSANLNLTCLGPIRFIIRNGAAVDFSTGNYDLQLAAGSSIEIEQGGQLGASSNCSASDLIKIGAVNVASCNGSGGGVLTDFPGLVSSGGYSSINVTADQTSFCNSGSSTITAVASPSSGATYKWYNAASGGSLLYTGNIYSTGTITTTTTYYVEASYISPTYTTIRKAVTITVTNASVPTGTTAQSFCASNSPTVANLAATGAAIKWYAGSTGGSALATTTALVNGAHYYATQTLSGCESATRFDVTATVTDAAIPLVGTISQPTCATPTGSVLLSGLPTTGTWTLSRSGTSSETTTGTGSSVSISGLASGTYYYAVTIGGCTSGTSTSVTINSITKTWNGSWSPSAPTSADNIVFSADYISSADLTACSCTVNAGVYVDINSGFTLTLTNDLVISPTGNILFKDKSSLVQINDVTNTGKIEYERKISSSIRETDYTYWSSPVDGFTLGEVYPDEGLFYSYGVSAGIEDWQEESSSTVMIAGKGYIINGAKPQSGPTPPGLSNPFFGVPNNGTITTPVAYTGNPLGTSNLLGNPYPSAINADLFLSTNSAVLEGTIYFWTHNTQIGIGVSNPGTGLYAYSGDDYASYNGTGGAAGSGGAVPSGKIAAGQGFFATGITAGTITFNNDMRVAGNNNQFFKTRNLKEKTASIEKNRVWLNLTNTQGAFKQTLVGYITDATNDYDNRFDGESFDGNEFVDFYSVNQDKNLVIQGRALPFDENDEVPLGFRTTINGAFTINIDQVDGLLTNQAVFIEDKLTNTITDLKSENYTFNTVPGTFNDRFVLKYSNKTLGTDNLDSVKSTVLVSNKNKQIKIDSTEEMIDKVTVFDLLGRQIYQKANVNSNELSISNLVSNRQVIVVKTVLQNGQEVSDKIIY